MPSLSKTMGQAAFSIRAASLVLTLAAATVVLASMPGAPASAAESSESPLGFWSCTAAPAATIPSSPTPLTARFTTPVQPGGSTAELSIPAPLPDGVQRRFVALFQWRTPVGRWQPVGEDAVEQYVVSVEKDGSHATKAIVRLPEPDRFWRRDGRMVLALCEKDVAEPLYVAVAEARVSDRASAIWLTILFVVVAYFGIVAVVDIIRTGSSFPTAGSLRRFDPVYLTSGVYGHGSISKLQILFFSFIAMGLLVYALLRTAILSDMSEDIVALLGIGGAGAAAAKGTAIARNRLSLKNWRWIVDRGWMTDEMRDKETLPAWSDLVMDGGEMNITKLQMLLFSAVVGFAMLSAGLAGLASFEVPDALLVLLGISQGVYVFGKATTPPIFKELDDALTKLIDAELAFKKVAAEKLTAADLPDDRAATLADCKVVAGAEYEAFIALEQSARNMVPVAFPAAKDLLSLTPDLPTA